MPEPAITVDCYAGYKGDERPVRLHLSGRPLEVVEVEGRWYSPGATLFRVVVQGGDRYVLRHEEAQDVWTIAGYRREVDRSTLK